MKSIYQFPELDFFGFGVPHLGLIVDIWWVHTAKGTPSECAPSVGTIG